ncbi:hypothetical protein CVT24_007306 [Panaeolus cyanescens]|uniref:Protein kinase domain-containing protein n=1 Tax=Panaeolus cyanescens TaxID=181874 RepID=A0A409VJ50_9AGAR|nr:hypothetical protein CVT24_007306 [Panaeolus cyanescens]
MLLTTPTKLDQHRQSPSCNRLIHTPPSTTRINSLSYYDSPMLSPSPLRNRRVNPDDDDEGSIFLASSTSTSLPLRTPVKQVHRIRPLMAFQPPPTNIYDPVHAVDTVSAATVGAGTKRKTLQPTTPHQFSTPEPFSTTNLSDSPIFFDRLPAPKFIARTPQTKAETEAYIKSQTATLTRLRLSDQTNLYANSLADETEFDTLANDSGCDMNMDMDQDPIPNPIFIPPNPSSKLYSRTNLKTKPIPLSFSSSPMPINEKEDIVEAVSPGGHINKRRARSRPTSSELHREHSLKSPVSPPTKVRNSTLSIANRDSYFTYQNVRNIIKPRQSGGVAFPTAGRASPASSSDAGSPRPKRRSNTASRVHGGLQSRRPLNRDDSVSSATLFFGPAIPQPPQSSELSRSCNSRTPATPPSTRPTVNNRHSYAGPSTFSPLIFDLNPRTGTGLPSPKSSPAQPKDASFDMDTDMDEDMLFNGPGDSSFTFSTTGDTPPSTKMPILSKYKPQEDSDDEFAGNTSLLPSVPKASSSFGSMDSDAALVTPGSGPSGLSGWPTAEVFVKGTDDVHDPFSRHREDEHAAAVDAFILEALSESTGPKDSHSKKRAPGTPVKKAKISYFGNDRPWQSAFTSKVGLNDDCDFVKAPRKSMPAAFAGLPGAHNSQTVVQNNRTRGDDSLFKKPFAIARGTRSPCDQTDLDVDTEDEDGIDGDESPSMRKDMGKYTGLGLGLGPPPAASSKLGKLGPSSASSSSNSNSMTPEGPPNATSAVFGRWLMRRSSSGAFSSGSESASLASTPTRNKGIDWQIPNPRPSLRVSPTRNAAGGPSTFKRPAALTSSTSPRFASRSVKSDSLALSTPCFSPPSVLDSPAAAVTNTSHDHDLLQHATKPAGRSRGSCGDSLGAARTTHQRHDRETEASDATTSVSGASGHACITTSTHHQGERVHLEAPAPRRRRRTSHQILAARHRLSDISYAENEQPGRFERDFVQLEEIGSGEFGQVFMVRSKRPLSMDGTDHTIHSDQVFAVKKSKRFEGAKHRLRLREEVTVLRHLSEAALSSSSSVFQSGRHPNVLGYIDSWEEDEALFIQTELCEKGNLARFLWRYGQKFPRLDEARVWKIVVDLSRGLKFIHDSGVIHLDIKPSNVFVTQHGRFKIGDFGMASLWPRPVLSASTSQNDTANKGGCSRTDDDSASPPPAQRSNGFEREGDKLYLAPEVLQGQYGKAADVFSFGMTILETASNIVVPDQGEGWHRLRNEDFSQVDLSENSEELVDLIRGMMRTDPKDRMTMNEVYSHPVVSRARLKVLEAIFKKDTKPNASLRTELAAQLDMTARGVQVWFQNRRAKEKTKSGKGQKGAKDDDGAVGSCSGFKDEDELVAAGSPPPPLPMNNECNSDQVDAFSSSSSPSPPQLHVITDSTTVNWNSSSVDRVPDSAPPLSLPTAALNRPIPNSFNNVSKNSDLLSLRRGSLPVNAFPIPESSVDSPIGDCFDPLSRRRSVDASLQRLASNPFANLARAKNSALYGPNFGVAPALSSGRHQLSQQGRPSYPYPAPHQRRVTSNLGPNMLPFPPQGQLPQGAGPIRRSSVDCSRSAAISSHSSSRLHSTSTRIHQSQSPSPSPLTPFNAAIRASLPDGQLYALSTRPVASPIPGPLPSPGFSFGAASTNSLASPSSGGDSDRNSPDSLRSFSFRHSANGNGTGNIACEDEDDATNSSVHQSPLFDPYDPSGYSQPSSRFGSIASIATSESSVASSAGIYYQDGLMGQDGPLNNDRRDSCASTGFLNMISNLDVGGGHAVDSMHQMGLAAGGYTSHDDYSNYVQVEAVNTCAEAGGEVQGCQTQPQQQQQSQLQQPAEMSYPSPASTISAQGSPHVQDLPVTSVPNTGSDPVTISTSSELAFALEGRPDQGNLPNRDNYLVYGDNNQQPEYYSQSPSDSQIGQTKEPTGYIAEQFAEQGHADQTHDVSLNFQYPHSGTYMPVNSTVGQIDNVLSGVPEFGYP